MTHVDIAIEWLLAFLGGSLGFAVLPLAWPADFRCHPLTGRALLAVGGLIGRSDRYLRAFERAGHARWDPWQATPVTSRGSDGRQHAVVTAGDHGALGPRYADHTIAFALSRT